MPNLGDTERAYNIGIAGHGLYIRDACPECGKERWVAIKHKGSICFQCGREAISERKRIPGLEACRPEDLGRKGNGWLYKVPCPECGTKRWVRKLDILRVCAECGRKQMGMTNRRFPELEMKYNKRGEPRYKSPCPECGGKLWRRADYVGKVCGECVKGVHAAQFRAITGEAHPNWNGGSSFEPYSTDFNATFKRYIRDRDGHVCQLCGISEEDARRALDVHHIDYDKRRTEEDNAISLCASCNAKVNKKRSYWSSYFTALLIRREMAELQKDNIANKLKIRELQEANADLSRRLAEVEINRIVEGGE